MVAVGSSSMSRRSKTSSVMATGLYAYMYISMYDEGDQYYKFCINIVYMCLGVLSEGNKFHVCVCDMNEFMSEMFLMKLSLLSQSIGVSSNPYAMTNRNI